jgi:twitching motility protein PilT
MAEVAQEQVESPSGAPELSLRILLKTMIEQKASDLHITVGSPPQLRIDGNLVPLKTQALNPTDTQRLCYSVLTNEQRAKFLKEYELDLSFGLRDLARFRANLFMQRGAVSAAFRQIPFEIRALEDLGVPQALSKLVQRSQGLILVTGPTGSGKSTTLASMVDLINRDQRGHIITIEDPIEFLHHHKGCLVNQRELGTDTLSFKSALKYVLRQDPDVVLIGEMRDLETIEAALTISETGHLALATLHTNSAAQTINRILDVFPAHQQGQVRQVLSFVLEGILSQQLIPKIGGGRALATELLIANQAIRNLIREDKIHQVYSHMQVGQSRYGMQTMNQSLSDLVNRGVIMPEEAARRSPEPDELKTMIRGAG